MLLAGPMYQVAATIIVNTLLLTTRLRRLTS